MNHSTICMYSNAEQLSITVFPQALNNGWAYSIMLSAPGSPTVYLTKEHAEQFAKFVQDNPIPENVNESQA